MRSWHTMHPGSYAFALNYIIIWSPSVNRTLPDSLTWRMEGGGMLISGEKLTEISVMRADRHCDFINTRNYNNTIMEEYKVKLPHINTSIQRWDTDRMTEASPGITGIFYYQYTTILFGPLTLLCGLKSGTFIFYFMSKGSVRLSDSEHGQTDTPLIHASGFCIHTDAGSPLLQLWYYLRRRIRAAVKLVGTMSPIRLMMFWTSTGESSVND